MKHSENVFGNRFDDRMDDELIASAENETSPSSLVPPPFFLTSHSTPVQMKETESNEERKDVMDEIVDDNYSYSIGRLARNKNASNSSEAFMRPPPFQLKADNEVIQREEEGEVKKPGPNDIVEQVKLKIERPKAPVFEIYNYDTYDELINALKGAEYSGCVRPQQIIYHNWNKQGKAIITTLVVELVKKMPKWPKLDEIKNQVTTEKDPDIMKYFTRIINAWNKVYASLDAHENHHIDDEIKHYNKKLKRGELKGKTVAETEAKFDLAELEANEISEAFHHDKKASAIKKWPIIELHPTKVP